MPNKKQTKPKQSKITKYLRRPNGGAKPKVPIKTKPKDTVKSTKMGGTDFIKTLKVYPDSELVNSIKIIYEVDISPSAFVGTRMELLSNLYQMYRFDKFHITYKPQIPDSINAVFIAYVDTDPEDKIKKFNKEELLRLAQSHQYAVQAAANKGFTVKMPILMQDDMFYTGDEGDKRFRKQGKLYIIQIGAVTNFSGDKVTKTLDVGVLNCNWSGTFANPQMQSMNRVFDGVSQKNILRSFSNLVSYYNVSINFGQGNVVGGSRFRHATVSLPPFMMAGTGDYQIITLPNSSTLPNSLKGVHQISPPYSDSKYQKTVLARTYIDKPGTTTEKVSSLDKYLEQAFSFLNGGVKIAKGIFDVASLVATFFVSGTDTSTTIATTTVADQSSFAVDNKAPIYGAVVVHNDGLNTPFIECYAEFEDVNHAAAYAVSDFNLNLKLMVFKLDLSKSGEAIDSAIPSLNFNYIQS
jgi:hypothetical protein